MSIERFHIKTTLIDGRIETVYQISETGEWVKYEECKQIRDIAERCKARIIKLATQLQDIKRSNGRCKKTLGYYGSRMNWEYPYMFRYHDGGAKARETLKEAK